MNYDEIITFLKVCETGSIAKAAQQLYIEQGTASRRILQMEAELDTVLFERKKGQRKTVLSEAGQRFLPIAEQMKLLFADAEQIKNPKSAKRLRIAAPQTITAMYMNSLYESYMNENPDVELMLQIEHSKEIYQGISRQIFDIGFVTSLRSEPNIIARKWFQEEYCILYHIQSRYATNLHFDSLVQEKEIYFRYSSEYETWHNAKFPYQSRKKITLGTLQSFELFLNDPEDWCILPETAAEAFTSTHSMYKYRKLAKQPPARNIYIIRNKYPVSGKTELIASFLDQLDTDISKQTGLVL